MVYNVQNYRDSALSIDRISKNYKTQRFGNSIYFRPQVKRGTHLLYWVH
jgi:hypothetical protein